MDSRRRLLIANAIKGGILPSGYKECEYLESTGTQYIDTGIACNNPYKWEFEIMQLIAGRASKNTSVNGAFEQVGASAYKRFHNANNVNNQWKFYVGMNDSESTYTTVGANVKQKISVDVRQNPAVVKIGSQTDSLDFGSYSNITALTFWLFIRNSNYEKRRFKATERIYSFKVINKQEKLVMNLVPCLDNNNIPCMYDTVSKTTFYNAGTGTFLYQLKS